MNEDRIERVSAWMDEFVGERKREAVGPAQGARARVGDWKSRLKRRRLAPGKEQGQRRWGFRRTEVKRALLPRKAKQFCSFHRSNESHIHVRLSHRSRLLLENDPSPRGCISLCLSIAKSCVSTTWKLRAPAFIVRARNQRLQSIACKPFKNLTGLQRRSTVLRGPMRRMKKLFSDKAIRCTLRW